METRARIRIGPCHLCPPKKVCGRHPFSPPHKRVTSPTPAAAPTGSTARAHRRASTSSRNNDRTRRVGVQALARVLVYPPPAQGLPIPQAMQPTCLRPASSFLARDLLAIAGALRKPKIPVPRAAEVGRGGGRREGERKRLCRRALRSASWQSVEVVCVVTRGYTAQQIKRVG